MKRYCLALDLKDDPGLIEKYKDYHKKVWPEIMEHLSSTGIKELEIYQTGNRLFMIMEVDENFSFEKKTKMDLENPKVQEWEELMWTFQKPLPDTPPGEKWILMEKIFELGGKPKKFHNHMV